MKLNHLSDSVLHARTKQSVANERSATNIVLHHLYEVHRRRLYSNYKCKSLHEYAEKELGYPGDQAYTRIAAMKLMREFPILEGSLKSGALTLTHLTDAARVFRKKNMSRSDKIQLLQTFENTTTREAKKIMVKIAPETLSPDHVRLMSEDQMEFKFLGSVTLNEKLRQLVGYYAHSDPGITLGELVEKLADIALEKKKSEMTPKHNGSQADEYREVWTATDGKCVKCGSTYALESDHIVAKGRGGGDEPANRRLLCRSCNQRAAIEVYGAKYMTQFLGAQKIMESPEEAVGTRVASESHEYMHFDSA